MNRKIMAVNPEDIKKMRGDCLILYLSTYPEKKGKKISDAELFASLVRFYLK